MNRLLAYRLAVIAGAVALLEVLCLTGVIDKITMSAFEATFLDIAMRDAKLEAFIIAGIALEVGIGPTVRQALDLNYIPVVVSDACGAKTAQNKERVLTEFADTGEVIVVDSKTLLPLLSD